MTSAWSPLRFRTFRALWIAALASNVGNWMHEVGGAWLMTELTPSPLMVALIGTAMSLPLFLFGLPAGAIADVVDRRKFLIGTLAWKALVTTALGAVTLLGWMTPWGLLAFTLALGLGIAMYTPAWQAVTPEVVPPEELPAAIALNGVAINVARAIGPAVGGLLVGATSPGVVFLLNAASYVALGCIIHRWKRPAPAAALPPETVAGAMRSGVRYVRNEPRFRAVCIRAGLFIVFGSAVWALLPVIGRERLGLGAFGYGLLLGAMGVGAVATATLLPPLRKRLSMDALVGGATGAFALATLALATVQIVTLAYLVMLLGGGAWICIMSSFNTAAQQTSATWVRARALAVYAIVFQGGTALGSAGWGALASEAGITTTLSLASAGMLVSVAATLRYRLPREAAAPSSPANHWPSPQLVVDARPDDGPVLVTIEYRIAPENEPAFAAALHDLERIRRRDGALEWGLYRDAADGSRFVEEFLVESWADHLRQHERFGTDDRELEARARSWQVLDTPVVVRHHVHVRRPKLPPDRPPAGESSHAGKR